MLLHPTSGHLGLLEVPADLSRQRSGLAHRVDGMSDAAFAGILTCVDHGGNSEGCSRDLLRPWGRLDPCTDEVAHPREPMESTKTM